MTRLFVAIWPSSEATAAIRAELARARARHPDLRWQPEERWHLTLAFLGDRNPERTGTALERLMAGSGARAAPVRVTGAGAFGPVLWLGVEHSEWLDELAQGMRRGLHATDGRFRAHITVARGRGRDGRRLARAAVADLAAHAGPWWTPQEVTLVDSVTGPQPRYTVLRTWPLPPADTSESGRHAGRARKSAPKSEDRAGTRPRGRAPAPERPAEPAPEPDAGRDPTRRSSARPACE